MKSKTGFTLIEIMVSLVLVGLIAGIAGTSVITATRSYLFARENNVITQKAQLALNRLNREMIELSDVRDASRTCVVYESPYGRRAVALLGNTVRLFTGYGSTVCPTTGGDVLVDGVQGFSILYNPNPDGTVSLWSPGQDIKNLSLVNIQLALSRPDTGGTVPFSMTVSPRNNNNSGGEALPTAASLPPEYSGKQCFVTTAAYGDADHPVVETLRQFRDRFLLPTETGRALVRFYYDVGPSLAAAIQDRPIACLLVRLLITPLAGFALLALYCPLLIPLLLLLSWAAARLTVKALARRALRRRGRLQGQHGAMLVTLIAALVVFSALGALMIGMFGTSALSQVAGNNAMKAYYLAESGFRYAAGEYINVTGATEVAREKARDSLLMDRLHGQSFSLGGDGSFKLDVYAYYFKAIQAPGGNALTARFFGGMPVNMGDMNNPFNAVWMKVQKPGGEITHNRVFLETGNISGTVILKQVDAGGNAVDWDSGHWDSISGTGSLITPVCVPDRAMLTLIQDSGGYDLAYADIPGILAFPEKNGIFTVRFQGETNPRILAYRQRDIANRRLKGVSDPNGGILPAGAMVDPGTAAPYQNFVELTKFVRLDSTGTIGTGASAVSRKVTYYAPIGYAQPEPKTQFQDKMLDFSKWQAGDHIGHIGTLAAGSSYGTTMRVDSTQATNATPAGSCLRFREFQVGLNWTAAALPVQQEWVRAGNYLSYDLEMKTFYVLSHMMVKHALGLTFRLDETGNAMGFTYARGVPGFDSYGCDNDGIPNGFLSYVSGDHTPVLLVWTKEYAKKEVNPRFEPSPHAVTPVSIADPPPAGTGTYALVTGQSFWQNGDRVRFVNTGGALPVGITTGRDYYIRRIESGGSTYLYLFSTLTGALNFDPLWPGLQDITGDGSGTTTIVVQDATFTKLAHQVLTSGNEYLGLIASLTYLKSWTTFMARVNEAPSVSFISGGGIAGREILSGEVVYQTSNNLPGGPVTAVYRVMRSPIYRAAKSGARLWPSGSEQGVLLLERIAGNSLSNPATAPFQLGYTIFVGEHPGGTAAGTVGVPGGVNDEVFRQRDNWLMFYVGDPLGKTPADVNPFNQYRGPILRNSVLWPPDNPQDTVINTDNFTLLRFSDYVNSSLSCRVNDMDRTGSYCLTRFYSKENTGSAGDILRFASPDGTLFYSPQSGTVFPGGRAEFGLHAYGNDAAYYTEFDDFALQFGPSYGITRQGFLLPIQQ